MTSSIIIILSIIAISIIITVIILRSTKESFNTEKKILYFYGENCNSCKNVEKIWESLQDKLKDNKEYKLEKINYDLKENKVKYPNIKSLPTILTSETQIYDPNSEKIFNDITQYYVSDIINWATVSN
jgi:thiol-disulfide isomerase/thioredoxin